MIAIGVTLFVIFEHYNLQRHQFHGDYATYWHGLAVLVDRFWVTGVMFPFVVLTLALTETWTKDFFESCALLGEISYSIYLIHFPLQLAFVLLLGRAHPIFSNGWFMLVFFAILITLSIVSFRKFELPSQRWIRRRAFGTSRFSRLSPV